MTKSDNWERFELAILRLCRKQYLGLAVLGVLAAGAGCAVMVVGFLLGDPVLPALPPELPPQRPLDLPAIERLRGSRPYLFNLDKTLAASLGSEVVVDVPANVRELFPDPPYSWEDVTQEYCRSPSAYGCLEKARRVAKVGIRRLISSVVKDLSSDEVALAFAGIRPPLVDSPIGKRAELVVPAIAAFAETFQAHQKAVAQRQMEIDDVKGKRVAAVNERMRFKEALIGGGLYAIASGLGTILLAGLFLAFLAMERHLRAIREGQLQR